MTAEHMTEEHNTAALAQRIVKVLDRAEYSPVPAVRDRARQARQLLAGDLPSLAIAIEAVEAAIDNDPFGAVAAFDRLEMFITRIL